MKIHKRLGKSGQLTLCGDASKAETAFKWGRVTCPRCKATRAAIAPAKAKPLKAAAVRKKPTAEHPLWGAVKRVKEALTRLEQELRAR